MDNTMKTLIVLLMLSLVDAIIPVPIIGAVLMYVVLARPPWFSDLVHEIYGEG